MTQTFKPIPADILRVVQAAFPNYRKKAVFVSTLNPDEPFEFFGTWWDGGSRSEYAIVQLSTMKRVKVDNHHPFFEPGKAAKWQGIRPTPGYVVVEAGTFRGKPATAHLHVHPADMPRWITA